MQRRRTLDLLKLALAVMVVGIHVNPFGTDSRAVVLITGDGLFRVAVPAFFVINGYFFQPRVAAGTVGPYLRRLVWLYLVWMALYLPVWQSAFFASDWLTIGRVWAVGWWHLWYLIAAALAAALATLVAHWSTQRLLALAGLAFLAGAAVMWGFAWQIWPPTPYWVGSPVWLHRNGLFLGLPFFLLGLLIRRHDLPARLDRNHVGIVALLACAALPLESLALEAIAPQGVSHDNLLGLAVAAPALVLWALMGRSTTARDYGTMANAIYFLHVFFVAWTIRLTDLPYPLVFLWALAGSALLGWGMIRSGLARRLL